MVMEADGSGRRSLRGCSFTPEAWSPDSRHVVCSDYEQGLVVLDTVDGTSTQIAESGEMSSWSTRRDDDRVHRREQAVRDPRRGRHQAPARHPQGRGIRRSDVVPRLAAGRVCLSHHRRSRGALDDRCQRTRRPAPGAERRRVEPQLVSGRLSYRIRQEPRARRRRSLRGSRRRDTCPSGQCQPGRGVGPPAVLVGRRTARVLHPRPLP